MSSDVESMGGDSKLVPEGDTYNWYLLVERTSTFRGCQGFKLRVWEYFISRNKLMRVGDEWRFDS